MEVDFNHVYSAGVAFLGVILGSFTSYLSTSRSKSKELAYIREKEFCAEKRRLYSAYLAEVNAAAINSIVDKSDASLRLQSSASLLSQIELIAEDDVYKKAQDVLECLINMYSKEPIAQKNSFADFRQLFIVAAKTDLARVS